MTIHSQSLVPPWILRAIAACVLGASIVCGAPAPRPTTTAYVGRHFEVRDHDQPTKYVFNGSTRLAHVTGSLSGNERIQRLRLRAGWNLVSLAVTAPDFLDQLREFTSGPTPLIKALYRWQPATSDYGAIASGSSVGAGTVLWISAQTNAVVALRGGYVEPTEWRAPASGTFVAAPALEAQPLTLPTGVVTRTHVEQPGVQCDGPSFTQKDRRKNRKRQENESHLSCLHFTCTSL